MKLEKMRVLHITPHLGGGVGSVLVDWLKEAKNDDCTLDIVACLDVCKPETIASVKAEGLEIHEQLYSKSRGVLWDLVSNTDVVLLHYWNHPLLTRLLIEEGLPKSRLICWCHVSGLWEPSVIPTFLVDMCEKVIFTSSISWRASNVVDRITQEPLKFMTIHSTRNLRPYLNISKQRDYKKQTKHIVYVGTVGYSKMHPSTVPIICQLSRNGFRVTLVGGPDHKEVLSLIRCNSRKVEVTGPLDDVKPYLKEADIFIYPLSKRHYGTGEQAILEAMGSGLPVVAFDNPAEASIIINNKTGRLVSTPHEFIQATLSLANSSENRKQLGTAAAKLIADSFSLGRNSERFRWVYDDVCKTPKVARTSDVNTKSNSYIDTTGIACILSSIKSTDLIEEIMNTKKDEEGITLMSDYIIRKIAAGDEIWRAATKGTPFHYERYFPDSYTVNRITHNIRRAIEKV